MQSSSPVLKWTFLLCSPSRVDVDFSKFYADDRLNYDLVFDLCDNDIDVGLENCLFHK